MRRILLVLSVAALMAAMMVATAMPAMAASPWTDEGPDSCTPEQNNPHDRTGTLFTKETKNSTTTKCYIDGGPPNRMS
jgi:hypothetical protein